MCICMCAHACMYMGNEAADDHIWAGPTQTKLPNCYAPLVQGLTTGWLQARSSGTGNSLHAASGYHYPEWILHTLSMVVPNTSHIN